MGKLFNLAIQAARRLLQRRTSLPPGGMRSTPGPPPVSPIPQRLPVPARQQDSRPGAPPVVGPVRPQAAQQPVQPPSQPANPPRPQPARPQPVQPPAAKQQESRDIQEVQETYDKIQLLGRDRGASDDMQAVMDGMRRVSSSNVYGYFFEIESGYNYQRAGSSSQKGLLYVTFLGQTTGGTRTDSPGTTYVYYDVPTAKFDEFQRASEASAGKAVWDYLRVRGTVWDHQHRYKLVQAHGEYVPRKATKLGFKTRQLAPAGQPKISNSTWSAISRLERSPNPQVKQYAAQMKRALLAEQNFKRSTLAPRSFLPNRAAPNRGKPNRGTP